MQATSRQDRVDAFSVFAVLAAVAGFAVAALALVIVSVRDPAATVVAAVPDAGDMSQMVHIRAELSEYAINLEADEIPVGSMIDVFNVGSLEHDLAVRGINLVTPMLPAGGVGLLDVSALPPGTYELICTVPGHEAAGMVTTLTISETAVVPVGGAGHVAHGADVTPEQAAQLDQAMIESILAFPAETEGRGNQPLEPVRVEPDGTKVFELTARIAPWEVEPGRVVDAWTFNGTVPGPWIHLEVGDRARFLVTNELPFGTDVHWHGITVPNDQDGVAPITQPLIEPGETFTYEFTVVEPMIGMYHPHAHGYKKLADGMLGAFTVGELQLPRGRSISGVAIPEDLRIVHEEPIVLNDAGVIGFAINGKSFPATEPIVVEQGDWILLHYMNQGLQDHPMHLHGSRQLVVARDGVPLDSPFWVDTINVAAGERYSVLVHASEPGIWVLHCHILTHVERAEGMFGMVTALIVS